ncbi:MAG TPA: hypothetical protein QGF86_06120, partial [Nitrospinaceae bacterium]|nr:hypothetical protein [Nitrospinaceae bacterium]
SPVNQQVLNWHKACLINLQLRNRNQNGGIHIREFLTQGESNKIFETFFLTMFLALFSGCTALAITGGGLGLCVFKCRL